FVWRKRHDDVARGHEAFLLQADQAREHRGVLPFHVDGATAVEPPVALGELERIERPVFAPSLDDVEMIDVEDRPLARAAAKTDDHARAVGTLTRSHDGDVRLLKSVRDRPRGNGFRRDGRPFLNRRVYRDQLAQDLAAERLLL